MTQYTKIQPKNGDVVVHCEHVVQKIDLKDKALAHFFKLCNGEVIKFTRPDGTNGEANWVVICDKCFDLVGMDFESVIRGDSTWQGDEPVIKQMTIQ